MADTKDEKIRFSFDTNGMEARVLAKIFQDTHYSFREISKAANQKEAEVKIYPFQQGSFEYLLVAITIGTSVITLFKEVINYKKSKLDLKKAQLTDTKSQINKQAELEDRQIIALHPVINIHVSRLLKTVSEHSSGFSLKDPNEEEEIISLKSSEIKRILEIEEKEGKKEKPKRQTIEKDEETLSLLKTSDKSYGMWEFIYGDIRIMASLPDFFKKDQFYKNLTPGTKLKVKLKIKQEFNKLAKAWENISYQKVHIYSYDQS